MANWACLPHDLLVFTAGKLKKFQDFSAFGTVCKTWHAAANKDRFKELWMQECTPYLLLPARRRGKGKGTDEIRDLYSWSEGNVVASIRVPNSSKRKCFESLGWFLAAGEDGSISLLDPFSSKAEIPLPPHPFPPHLFESVRKMVLSARPDESSDFIVAIVDRLSSDLAFWRSGETSWHIIKMEPGKGYFHDVTYHSGHFYSLDSPCKIRIHNFVEGQVITSLVADRTPQLQPLGLCYLGELRCIYITKTDEDSLLLVIRKYQEYGEGGREDFYSDDDYGERYIMTKKFEVYEFNFPLGTWREVDNLGNMAIFVSNVNSTTVVDVSRFHGVVKPNHIYFMDDCHLYEGDNSRMDRGTYNMENKRIDPFCHKEEFHIKTSRPTWFLPIMWPLSR